MSKLTQAFARIFGKANVVLLGVLGFSATAFMKCAYGTPFTYYVLNGNVKSASTEQAITGISVSDGQQETTTNEKGEFNLVYEAGFPENDTFILMVEDIDGELNGSYEGKEINVHKEPTPLSISLNEKETKK